MPSLKLERRANMSKKSHKNFIKVPNGIFNLKLNHCELKTLLFMLSFQNAPKIYPSIRTISKKTKTATSSVNRAVASLEAKEIIFCKKGNEYASNSYSINFDIFESLPLSEDSSTSVPNFPDEEPTSNYTIEEQKFISEAEFEAGRKFEEFEIKHILSNCGVSNV